MLRSVGSAAGASGAFLAASATRRAIGALGAAGTGAAVTFHALHAYIVTSASATATAAAMMARVMRRGGGVGASAPAALLAVLSRRILGARLPISTTLRVVSDIILSGVDPMIYERKTKPYPERFGALRVGDTDSRSRDFTPDFTPLGDTIIAGSVVISRRDGAPITSQDLTTASPVAIDQTSLVLSVWLTGGIEGVDYFVSFTANTAQGRAITRDAYLQCVSQVG
jgi:hypothetical protein